MKRTLSLVIALAMILSMMPTVFAAEDQLPPDIEAVGGEAEVLEELGWTSVTLAAGEAGIYAYTAEGDGTITVYIGEISEGVEGDIVLTNKTTGQTLSLNKDGVDNYGLELTVEVSNGDSIEIQVTASAAAEMTWVANFAAVLGSQANPIYPEWTWSEDNIEATATVTAPVGTTYYAVNGAGMVLSVNGEEWGTLVSSGMGRAPAVFSIKNEGEAAAEYSLQIAWPVGSYSNPEIIWDPTAITAVVADGNDQGYYYSWYNRGITGTLTLNLGEVTGNGTFGNVILTNGTTGATAWMSDSEGGDTVSMDVVPGDFVTIQVAVDSGAEWNYPGATINLTGEITYPLGSSENPETIWDPSAITAVVADGNSQGYYYSWYNRAITGTLTLNLGEVTGNGALGDVILTNGTTNAMAWMSDSEGGNTVSLDIAPNDFVTIQVTVDSGAEWNYPGATINLTGVITTPAGSMDNPAALEIGETIVDIAEGSQGYFFTWTAEKAGTLSVEMPADMAWTYVINNLTTGQYGDTQWSDSDPVVGVGTVEVAAGDVIQIMVNTYDAENPWVAPAGKLNVKVAFEAKGGEAPVVLGDVTGDGKVLANDAMVLLQYSINVGNVDVAVGDVTGDGKILANDAMLVLQRSVNPDTKFPAEN